MGGHGGGGCSGNSDAREKCRTASDEQAFSVIHVQGQIMMTHHLWRRCRHHIRVLSQQSRGGDAGDGGAAGGSGSLLK